MAKHIVAVVANKLPNNSFNPSANNIALMRKTRMVSRLSAVLINSDFETTEGNAGAVLPIAIALVRFSIGLCVALLEIFWSKH